LSAFQSKAETENTPSPVPVELSWLGVRHAAGLWSRIKIVLLGVMVSTVKSKRTGDVNF